ncbi:MAG: FAD-dependent oxidoreductase [Planctomycetota bacterium]|nr:FAD-dependent oxidoreductase [Planctomycetota bacterium]
MINDSSKNSLPEIRLFVTLVLLLQGTASPGQPNPDTDRKDVVIYGGTSAAISAAVQARRMKKNVIIVCPDQHLGGLTSSGLGWTDSGNKEVIGGIAREFYQRIRQHYDQPSAWKYQAPSSYSRYRAGDDAMWVFEPRVAEQAFENLVAEYKIPVHRNSWLDRKKGVVIRQGKIDSIRMLDGKSYRAKVFIDATYEGDLMAAAGISFHVGREANSQYGETLNGVQTVRTVKHQFDKPVSAYVQPGDPASGLLPRIHADPPGKDGTGDHRVQAYNYRMCLTREPRNRVPFPKPDNYDPLNYELLARYLDAGWREVWRKFDPAPNLKTDTNNHGAFSTDNIGMNYDYPEASYERRREILQEHTDYQQGLMWFLAYDPRVPADVRKRMSEWGLARDEFTDNGHWPHQIYVREARRMVSDFVQTELTLRGIRPTPNPIGMGSYNMDSHNVQRYVDPQGNARNEGDIQISPGRAYPISYGAIVPKRNECTNLLVPVCLSSSHIAYGSIRMEPVFMILGQSAATAAAIAIDREVAVQEVPYASLRDRLLADKQVLEYRSLRKPKAGSLVSAELKGIVIDDAQATLKGNWLTSSSILPYVDAGYRHDGDTNKGKCSATFSAQLKPGRYEVRMVYSANPNRSPRVTVTVQDRVFFVDQTRPPNQNPYHSLGKFQLPERAKVTVTNAGTSGHVIIDAVQFLPVR